MPTLGQLKSQIADDLARSDLSQQIAGAIEDSIRSYETERLWFNTTRNLSFLTVPDQGTYGSAAHALIPSLIHIDAVKFTQLHPVTLQSQSIYSLDKWYPQDFDDYALTGGLRRGRPTCYTYQMDDVTGQMQLRLWPVPDRDDYTMRVYATYRLPPLASDAESNAWTTEAAELIRTSAKLRIYFHITDDAESAMTMRLGIQALLDQLRTGTSMRTGLGRIHPTDF